MNEVKQKFNAIVNYYMGQCLKQHPNLNPNILRQVVAKLIFNICINEKYPNLIL